MIKEKLDENKIKEMIQEEKLQEVIRKVINLSKIFLLKFIGKK